MLQSLLKILLRVGRGEGKRRVNFYFVSHRLLPYAEVKNSEVQFGMIDLLRGGLLVFMHFSTDHIVKTI